jgi:hypothetical protein
VDQTYALFALLTTFFMVVFYLGYSSTLKMKAKCSCKTSVDFEHSAWHYIQQIELFMHNRLGSFDGRKSAILPGWVLLKEHVFDTSLSTGSMTLFWGILYKLTDIKLNFIPNMKNQPHIYVVNVLIHQIFSYYW